MAFLCISLAGSLLTAPALGGTITKMNAAKDNLLIRLTPDDDQELGQGTQVTIRPPAGADLSGIVTKFKPGQVQVKLSAAGTALKKGGRVTVKAAGTADGIAATAPAGGMPASKVITLTKGLMPVYATAFDNEDSSRNQSGFSADLPEPLLLGQFTRVQFLFMFGQFQLGPDLAYFSQTNKAEAKVKSDTEPGDGASETIDVKLSAYEFGLTLKYLIFPYAPYQINPMVQLGFGIANVTSKYGEEDPVTTSGQNFNIGFGMQYFLTPTFAAEAAFAYRSDTLNMKRTSTDEDPSGGTSSGEPTTSELTVTQKLTTTGITYGLNFYF